MKISSHRFSPHPLLRSGNVQTLAAALLPQPRSAYRAKQWLVDLPDGDQLVLHDDRPEGWFAGDRVAILAHGLGGSHRSPYMVRVAQKLNSYGIRTFRLDLRGCGAGEHFARGAAHLGSWDDLRQAIRRVAQIAPDAPTEVVGFSLGGCLTLNLAGRLGDDPCGNLTGAMAVCPPIDLHALDASFRRGAGRIYSRYLAAMMWRHIRRRLRTMTDPPEVNVARRPRHIRELDEQITAPFHGFRDADHYYDEASAARFLPEIRLPTRIVASSDDPVIPIGPLLEAPRSPEVDIIVTRRGGHLGFVGRHPDDEVGDDPDNQWIDWRVVEWVTRTGQSRGSLPAG